MKLAHLYYEGATMTREDRQNLFNSVGFKPLTDSNGNEAMYGEAAQDILENWNEAIPIIFVHYSMYKAIEEKMQNWSPQVKNGVIIFYTGSRSGILSSTAESIKKAAKSVGMERRIAIHYKSFNAAHPKVASRIKALTQKLENIYTRSETDWSAGFNWDEFGWDEIAERFYRRYTLGLLHAFFKYKIKAEGYNIASEYWQLLHGTKEAVVRDLSSENPELIKQINESWDRAAALFPERTGVSIPRLKALRNVLLGGENENGVRETGLVNLIEEAWMKKT